LDMSRRLTGESNPHTISAEFELGQHYQHAGDARQAIGTLEPAFAAAAKAGRDNTREYFIAERLVGEAYSALNRRAEALQHLRNSAEGLRKLVGDESIETRRSTQSLARISQAVR